MQIIPMRDLKNTVEVERLCAEENGPVFVTKNGYSDLVVMSSELYDKFARTNRIDQAIYESEKDLLNGGKPVDAEKIFTELDMKYFG